MAQQLVFFRLLTLTMVALVFVYGERDFIRAIFFPYIFTHYIVAFLFAFKKGSLKNKPKRYLPILILLTGVAFALSYYQVVNILIYFGIHFILTELYVFRFLGWHESKFLFCSRVPFNIIAYSFFARSAPIIGENLTTNIFIVLGVISFLAVFLVSFLKKEKFPIYEIPMFLALMIAGYFDLSFPAYGVLFYHVTLWYFLPIIKYKAGSVKPTLIQLGLFLALLGFIQFGGGDLVAGLRGANPIGLFAIFHITISFATSVLNPKPVQSFLGYR